MKLKTILLVIHDKQHKLNTREATYMPTIQNGVPDGMPQIGIPAVMTVAISDMVVSSISCSAARPEDKIGCVLIVSFGEDARSNSDKSGPPSSLCPSLFSF